MTDSGGLQEEAPGLGVPVIVLRDRTERQEGVDAGVARLVGTEKIAIMNAIYSLFSDEESYLAMKSSLNPYGDGHASERIIKALGEQSPESMSKLGGL
jgi:UDP-N-acetylglucosamine 2-epimerase (non-hydrolysing)